MPSSCREGRVEELPYIKRLVDPIIEEYLSVFGAVVVEGPKWCGKTTSSSRVAASAIGLADPAGQFQNRRFAVADPSLALAGERPRLVDEWQEVPQLWDAVRYACDEARGRPGQFILTGSSVPRPHGDGSGGSPMHSGAGRFGRVRMSTLTFFETGRSSGSISLSGMFRGERRATPPSALRLEDIADAVCRGGWPAAVSMTTRQASLIARSYLEAVASSGISRVDGVRRSPARTASLIASLARNESTLATNKTILADLGEGGMADSTLRDYLDALKRIYLIEDVPAWSPALRSPVKIRAASKRHLADPSLAAAALGASPESLLADMKTLGFLFESLVTHDLMVYAQACEARVMHYRDDSGLEADAIVAKGDGSWGAVEVKLGAAQEDGAASALNALERKMVGRGERPPAFKAVVVGTGAFGHERADGVQVVPFDQLGA